MVNGIQSFGGEWESGYAGRWTGALRDTLALHGQVHGLALRGWVSGVCVPWEHQAGLGDSTTPNENFPCTELRRR